MTAKLIETEKCPSCSAFHAKQRKCPCVKLLMPPKTDDIVYGELEEVENDLTRDDVSEAPMLFPMSALVDSVRGFSGWGYDIGGSE